MLPLSISAKTHAFSAGHAPSCDAAMIDTARHSSRTDPGSPSATLRSAVSPLPPRYRRRCPKRPPACLRDRLTRHPRKFLHANDHATAALSRCASIPQRKDLPTICAVRNPRGPNRGSPPPLPENAPCDTTSRLRTYRRRTGLYRPAPTPPAQTGDLPERQAISFSSPQL